MESLLRLSGLLSETDARKTDLGVLEKRLADRAASPTSQQQQQQQQPQPPKASTIPPTYNTFMSSSASPSNSTPRGDMNASPRASSAAGSPDSQKESEAEVDSLSDMMCSLVTNNCGETRYIGIFTQRRFSLWTATNLASQDPPLGSQYFRQRASSG